ncbi:MAG: hypothetical protein GY852_04110, partial [bacterium]|nr:hypothetical protein [bacterium]
EPWDPELYNDVWMYYETRINPDGTVSFFRNDTLRHSTTASLDLSEQDYQTCAFKGASYKHIQIMDNVSVSTPVFSEDWEDGLNFIFWKTWGEPLPQILPGAGWNGSDGFDSRGDGSYRSGVSSYQCFNLEMFPSLEFKIVGSSSSGNDSIRIGWSSSNSSSYGGTGEQPELAIFLEISPSSEGITFNAYGEEYSEPWTESFDNSWMNYSVRLNRDSTISFFRADTLRWRSTEVVSISELFSQCITIEGTSNTQTLIVDEIAVYPSSYLPGGFLLPLNSIYFLNSLLGWAVGDNGAIVHTSDAGASWEEQPSGVLHNLNDIYFESETRGWICCDSSFVLVTFNGTDWISTSTETFEDLNGIGMADLSTGWTVGNNSLILKTLNGGFNWQEQISPVIANLTDVEVVNTETAFASGSAGHIIRTLDGTNWEATNTGVSVDLNGLSFVDTLLGWAVGNSGTILKTVNGGESWIEQESSITGDLYGVSFFDSTHGWIVGAAGVVLYSENGGDTWVLQPGGRGEEPDLRGVHSCEPTVAWGVSASGLFGFSVPSTGIEGSSAAEEERLRISL